MKLTINVKLLPTTEQVALLLRTLERANAAADYASERAWTTQTFGQFALQKLVYLDLKTRFELTAQMVVRAVSKVADAYKKDRKTRRAFRPQGSIAYDDRILRFKPDDQVSLWVLGDRQIIPFTCGGKARALLPFRKGETDLSYIRGQFYLNVVCDVDEPDQIGIVDFLGIDGWKCASIHLGIVNIAVDSDGTVYSGEEVETARRIFAHRRRNLQRKGTRAARRKLRTLKGKQARFQANENHIISKQVVATAQRTSRGIALENLKGIRDRVTARRRQRARLANWGFYQLKTFIGYKAKLAGVPVILVNPRNTSRACPVGGKRSRQCGCIDKANRPTQSRFSCVSCGFSGSADHIAARNIGGLAGTMAGSSAGTEVPARLPAGFQPPCQGCCHAAIGGKCASRHGGDSQRGCELAASSRLMNRNNLTGR